MLYFAENWERDFWKGFLTEWGLTDETAKDFKGNPIDNLAPLVAAGIPVMGVCGDRTRRCLMNGI